MGTASGWAITNFMELQDENSPLSTGPLSLEHASMVSSIENIGSFIGSFIIVPISQFMGVKRTIHFLGLPLIVRK